MDNEVKSLITYAPGILPAEDTRCTGENAMWRVKATWKGAQKSSADGGLQDKHDQPWRGWPSIRHRTVNHK